MKTITIYEAIDGTRFDDEKSCRNYEILYHAVESLMNQYLSEKPMHGSTVYHVLEDVQKALEGFILYCRLIIKGYDWVWEDVLKSGNLDGQIYRLLSDCSSDYPILWKTFQRLRSIDKNGIEKSYKE